MSSQNKENKQRVLGVIPARLRSSRLPEKMLKEINGKPLIYHTWCQAMKATTLDSVVIATDSKMILDVAKSFGAEVVMTSENIDCGSDRVATVARSFKKFDPLAVVNIQGDEPMMPPEAIDLTVRALLADKEVVVSTPATLFINPEDIDSPNFVKVVTDQKSNALYFSRSRIPFPREIHKVYWKHLGLYAFRANFLQTYVSLPVTELEQVEKLEQLRILEHGYRIRVVKGDFKNMEVNTIEELERARLMMGDTTLT